MSEMDKMLKDYEVRQYPPDVLDACRRIEKQYGHVCNAYTTGTGAFLQTGRNNSIDAADGWEQ